MRRFGALLLCATLSCTGSGESEVFDPYDVQVGPYQAEVRWTSWGIPHILAEDYGSGGYGMGYAFARDHVCVLADQVIKVRSERSRWFGPGSNGRNLDSDFGWLHLGIRQQAEQGFRELDEDLQQAIIGYAAGYNRYVQETGIDQLPEPCRGAEWFPTVDHIDLLTYYLHLGQFASGYVFVDAIGNAAPPDDARRRAPPDASMLEELRNPKLGSNGWGIGADRSSTGQGMLLSNTHFPAMGERRWHEAHLTIGDELNVYGASLMGVPVINMGFNEDIAWTHTVSGTSRFTVYQLDLVEDQPTTYLYDGQEERMTPNHYRIEVMQEDGSLGFENRILYTSRYGPLVNIPLVGWTPLNAFTFRDVNTNNLGLAETWRKMNRASNLEEFKASHRDHQGIPWVHTMYADREGRAWYADSAVTPNLSPEAYEAYDAYLEESVFASLFAGYGVMVLDGSDPIFAWVEDERAARPGAIPFDDNPQLERSDFVSNANENYWLSNPLEPLDGYPDIYGETATRRTPRTKMNNRMLLETGAGTATGEDGVFTLDELEAVALSGRASIAEDLRAQVVERCTDAAPVPIASETVDLAEACAVLAAWDGTSSVGAQGAVLWREFLLGGVFEVEDLGTVGTLYGNDFDPQDPVYTPNLLAAAPASGVDPILEALALAVLRLGDASIPLDTPLGDVQVQRRGGAEYPVLGGNYAEGVISISTWDGRGGDSTLYDQPGHDGSINETTSLGPDGYVVNGGNSWIMAMQFTEQGPEARAIMVYSQSNDPASPHYDDQCALYATESMRPIAFTEAQIAADLQDSVSLSLDTGGE